MGYNISTIKNLPLLSGYYFFLLGKSDYTYGRSGTALYQKFDEIAERIGETSAIVKSFNSHKISDELLNAIYGKKWFSEMYVTLLSIEPALVITKPNPTIFYFKDHELFAVIPFDVLDIIYSNEVELIKDIISLSISGDTSILKKANKLENGISILRKIGKSLVLEPNINGCGLDIKKLFSNDDEYSRPLIENNLL